MEQDLTLAPRATPADVARHYEELDAFYRELWGEHVHHGLWSGHARDSVEAATRRLVDLVAERAELRPGDRVCDVGCGYGATARVLATSRACEVVGITLSPAQHARAAAAAPPGCRFLLGDWLENELEDASFDAVIAVESTAHMADKERAIAEMSRVIRPGGRAVICAWLASEGVRGWRRTRLLEPICREGRLPELGTEREYAAWLSRAGLQLRRFEDLTRRVRGTWSVVSRRAGRALLTRPAYARYLLRRDATERAFILAVARIWLAYWAGAMRYGLFAAVREE